MNGRLTVNTAPAAEPITATEAKTQARVDISDDDSYIDALITSARRYVENYTRLTLVHTTYDYTLPAFQDVTQLPRGPVSSISQITYVDGDGNSQTAATSKYNLVASEYTGEVHIAPDQIWPSDVEDEREDAVTITFVSGFGANPSDVPEDLRLAVRFVVAHWYDLRVPVLTGTIATEVPLGVRAILNQYRIRDLV